MSKTINKIDKLDFININFFVRNRILSKKRKDNLQNRILYFQITHLIRIYYPEYVKSLYNLTKRETIQF